VALPAAVLGNPLRLDDLVRRKDRASDVANLARVNQVRERAERLVDVARGIRTVDLIEVDPVRAQPA
jgi:hypothetical protein